MAKINSGSIDDITVIIEENGTVLGIFENVLDIIGAKRAAELITAERPENGYAALSDATATVNAHSLTESVNACKNADKLPAGNHDIELIIYGNRYNTFAGLHNVTNDNFYSPLYWRTEGDGWCYEYRLKDMGIMSAPVISVFTDGEK